MPNAYANKVQVVRGGQTETLIDLTADTAIASDVAQGKYFHLASGERVVGTATGGGGSAYQDEDGYIILGEEESDTPQGNISITANGTYDVADYAGANVNIPVGMTETDLKNYIARSNSFTGIDWPDGTTIIGNYAFAGCTYFNTESLPSGLTHIGSYAFQNCSRLALTSLPNGVLSIAERAFQGCSRLALTSLPSALSVLSQYSFFNCTNLALTTLPSGVTSIEPSALRSCPNITLTSLPSGLTSIGTYAFQGCSRLALTSLPIGVTVIGNYTFAECSGLTSISSDAVITTLAQNSFTGTASNPMALASVSFPNLVISILYNVFGSTTEANACQQLAFCDIGAPAQLSTNAFANCHSLTTLVLRKSDGICTLANVNAFNNTPMGGYNGLTGTIYVPSALISSYQTATNWSTLYNGGTVTFSAIEGSDYEL